MARKILTINIINTANTDWRRNGNGTDNLLLLLLLLYYDVGRRRFILNVHAHVCVCVYIYTNINLEKIDRSEESVRRRPVPISVGALSLKTTRTNHGPTYTTRRNRHTAADAEATLSSERGRWETRQTSPIRTITSPLPTLFLIIYTFAHRP